MHHVKFTVLLTPGVVPKGLVPVDQVQVVTPPLAEKDAEDRENGVPLTVMVVNPALL